MLCVYILYFFMVAFSLFWISVYWYGIFYFLTFIFWYIFFYFLKKYSFLKNYAPSLYNFIAKHPEDLLLYVILGVLIWWRLGHIFIYDFSYYLANPLHIFFVWEWGMSFIWWIIWVLLILLFVSYKNKFSFVDFFVLGDILVLPATFGIMIWRIGNFLNQELYGRLVYDVFPSLSYRFIDFFSSIHVFHVYDNIDNSIRINTNFLSSFFEWFFLLVVTSFILFSFLKNKFWKPWLISLLFLFLYSLIRFLMEYLRADSQLEYIGFFTKSQWFFLIFILLSVCLFLSLRRRYIK